MQMEVAFNSARLSKDGDCHDRASRHRPPQVVGVGCARAVAHDRGPRFDDPQRRAADARDRTGRLDRAAAVVRRRLQPRARRGAAAGGPARRSLRPQAHAPDRVVAVRRGVAGVLVRRHQRTADRRPGPARPRRSGAHAALDVDPAGALHTGGAAAGTDDLGHRELARNPARPDRRRVAARQLPLGLGVLDQRAGGPGRAGRRSRSCCRSRATRGGRASTSPA